MCGFNLNTEIYVNKSRDAKVRDQRYTQSQSQPTLGPIPSLPVPSAVLLPDDPSDDGATDPGERERLRHRRHYVVYHFGAVPSQRIVQGVLAVIVL